MNDNPRTLKMFRAWYQDQSKYSMSWEDWIYCGILLWSCIVSFGIGLVIGFIWLLFI
jgi:hypothetical protein